MDITGTTLEVIKYTIPALIVLLSSYLIVNKFLVSQTQRKQLALFQDAQDVTLKLRLHAYERLVMFVERIHPRQIIPRLYDPSMTVYDLQLAITTTIKAEFEHNLSQQIYISKHAWETVKNVKEQEIAMVNGIAKTLNPEASAKELHVRILEFSQKSEGELPTDVALHVLNDEAKKVLSYGAI